MWILLCENKLTHTQECETTEKDLALGQTLHWAVDMDTNCADMEVIADNKVYMMQTPYGIDFCRLRTSNNMYTTTKIHNWYAIPTYNLIK